jgi:hypothetical protein
VEPVIEDADEADNPMNVHELAHDVTADDLKRRLCRAITAYASSRVEESN